MPTPATPSAPKPAGDDRNLVAVDATTAVTFEDKVNLFWKNNRTAVIALCVVIVVAIAGKGLWDYMAGQKELEVEKAYAAATTTEQLKAFSAAHEGHSLGGIAQLRIADEAYAAGKSADAITAYDKAAASLKTGPLAVRAKMGRALAKVQAGKTAEAITDLKAIADDTAQAKSARAEATYHLASLAVEAGNAGDAQKFIDQVTAIEPMGSWMQRAFALRAMLPPAPAAPAAPASEKKDDAATPGLKLELPGKK
ncbi:MAG: tetratricopeptide repeat protein [Opitutaceae bacterium]